MNACCQLGIQLKESVLTAVSENTLTSPLIKVSKYADQIVIYILRVAPADIMD